MLGLSWIDWTVVSAYIAGITGMGLYANRAVTTTGDYFMGGRRFGIVKMVAQAFGTGTRTDQAVAVIGASAQVGLAGIWYQWLYLFATPFFWIIAPIYRRLRYLTIGDFFEKRYGASMGAAYAFVGLLFFAVNIGIVLKGTGVTIEAMTHGAISAPAAVVGMMVFFLAYGLLGGLEAVGLTHTVQGFFILLLSFLLIPFALHAVGGLAGVRSALPDGTNWFGLIAETEVTGFFVIMAVLNGLVGVTVQPHHMAINGAGKDELSCRSGWTLGTFIKRFATLGWAFSGIFIAAVLPELATVDAGQREHAFGLAVRQLLPVGFAGLMLAAMIAAVVAACNAFMVNGSALFTRNFYERYLRPEADEAHYLRVARAAALAIVLAGVTVALFLPSVVAGLLWIWKLMAFLGIAFWMAVVWRRSNRYGAWTALVVTAALAAGTEALGWSFPAQVALYLPIGFASLIIASLLTPPEPADALDAFYELLHTPVGHEDRLRAAGIPIIHEGDVAALDSAQEAVFASASGTTAPTVNEADDGPEDTPQLTDDAIRDDSPTSAAERETLGEPAMDRSAQTDLEADGHGLLVVDLLRLPKTFSVRRYALDLKGFGASWAAVAGYLTLALALAWLAG